MIENSVAFHYSTLFPVAPFARNENHLVRFLKYFPRQILSLSEIKKALFELTTDSEVVLLTQVFDHPDGAEITRLMTMNDRVRLLVQSGQEWNRWKKEIINLLKNKVHIDLLIDGSDDRLHEVNELRPFAALIRIVFMQNYLFKSPLISGFESVRWYPEKLSIEDLFFSKKTVLLDLRQASSPVLVYRWQSPNFFPSNDFYYTLSRKHLVEKRIRDPLIGRAERFTQGTRLLGKIMTMFFLWIINLFRLDHNQFFSVLKAPFQELSTLSYWKIYSLCLRSAGRARVYSVKTYWILHRSSARARIATYSFFCDMRWWIPRLMNLFTLGRLKFYWRSRSILFSIVWLGPRVCGFVRKWSVRIRWKAHSFFVYFYWSVRRKSVEARELFRKWFWLTYRVFGNFSWWLSDIYYAHLHRYFGKSYWFLSYQLEHRIRPFFKKGETS